MHVISLQAASCEGEVSEIPEESYFEDTGFFHPFFFFFLGWSQSTVAEVSGLIPVIRM